MALDPALDPIFDSAGKTYNVDPDLLKSIALQESGGSTARSVVSSAGAQGLMQLLPSTAERLGVTDPFDPVQAIPAAASLIAQGLDKGEAIAKDNPGINPVNYALMTYIGGDNTAKWGAQTQAYPGGVAAKYANLTRGAAPPSAATEGGALMAPLTVEDSGRPGDGGGMPPGSAAPPGGAGNGAAGAPGALPPPGGSAGAGAGGEPVFTGGLDRPPPGAYPKFDMDDILAHWRAAAQSGQPGAAAPYEALWNSIHQNGMPYSDGKLYPLPGQQETMRGKAEAQQQPTRVTEAVVPQAPRPGEGIFYPPLSPIAALTRGAAGAAAGGSAAGGSAAPAPQMYAPLPGETATGGGAERPAIGGTGAITPTPGGGVLVGGSPPTTGTGKFFDQFEKAEEAATKARGAMFLADRLQKQLNDLPSTGPMTDYLGELDKLAEQWGVPPDIRAKFHFPPGAGVAVANKLRIDLLGEILRQTFPGRITNTDIQTMSPAVAGPTTPIAANNYMIDQILRPQLQRDVDRYGAIVGLPHDDPNLVTLPQRLYEWDQNPANSFEAYRQRSLAAATGAPGGGAGATPAPASGAAPVPRRFRYDPASRALVPQ